MNRKKTEEREIISQSPRLRPYAVKLQMHLEKNTELITDECCLLLPKSNQVIVTLKKHTKDRQSLVQNNTSILKESEAWDILVEGFTTASQAEQVGKRVAFGLLLASIKGYYSMQLIYHTPLPCIVYDRTIDSLPSSNLHGTLTRCVPINKIIESIDETLVSLDDINKELLVSAELFASARLETSEKAKFIGLISSLEPLAEQKKESSDELNQAIDEFKTKLKSLPIDESTKNSLLGRAEGLKQKSVRQAIKSLISEVFDGCKEKIKLVDEAYGIRSQILHTGYSDSDLQQKSEQIEKIIRKVIEYKFNRLKERQD